MSAEAFTNLVDAHYGPLYRFALSLARNPQDASDLVQETFLIWATKGASLRDMNKVKTWLFTTLYREFLRARRGDARVASLEAAADEAAETREDEIDRVRRLDASTVMTALQTVPESYRAPLTLFYLDDLTYQEIAAALNVPIGTVMSRLSRGKALLRRALGQAEDGREVEPSAKGNA